MQFLIVLSRGFIINSENELDTDHWS